MIIKTIFINCNTKVILIKIVLFIKIIDLKNYKKANFCIYQFITKLRYFAYKTKLNIAFAIGQFSKYNINLRKNYKIKIDFWLKIS